MYMYYTIVILVIISLIEGQCPPSFACRTSPWFPWSSCPDHCQYGIRVRKKAFCCPVGSTIQECQKACNFVWSEFKQSEVCKLDTSCNNKDSSSTSAGLHASSSNNMYSTQAASTTQRSSMKSDGSLIRNKWSDTSSNAYYPTQVAYLSYQRTFSMKTDGSSSSQKWIGNTYFSQAVSVTTRRKLIINKHESPISQKLSRKHLLHTVPTSSSRSHRAAFSEKLAQNDEDNENIENEQLRTNIILGLSTGLIGLAACVALVTGCLVCCVVFVCKEKDDDKKKQCIIIISGESEKLKM